MAICATFFFFEQNRPQKCLLQHSRTKKNAFLGYKNKKFKKSKNCHFSKEVNSWSWSKNGHFFNFYFLRKIGQENVFYDILEQKTPVQAIKTRSLKSRKFAIILNELTHCFCKKMAIFPSSFFQSIQARKMCFTIFQNERRPFQTLKTRSLKIQKLAFFQRG